MRFFLVWFTGCLILALAVAYPSHQYIKECKERGGVAVHSSEGYTCLDRKYGESVPCPDKE